MPCPVPMLAAGAHPVVPGGGGPAIVELAPWQSANGLSLDYGSFAEGPDRGLIIGVSFQDPTAARHVTGIDVGGQAAQQANDGVSDAEMITLDGECGVDVWYILESQIAAATDGIITVSWDTVPDAASITAGLYKGFDQTGGSTTVTGILGDSATDGTQLTLNFNNVLKGELILGVYAVGNSTDVSWESSMTEVVEIDNSPGLTSSVAQGRAIQGGEDFTLQPTAVSQNRAVVRGIGFKAAA